MPEDHSHHKSKKREYDILLVPSDDAGKSKSLRLSPWQIGALLGGSVVLVSGMVLLLLIFTPLGPLVPIPNPALENRYNRELLSIKQRMSDLMEEMVRLRTYSVKLRQALGEHVALNDSGTVVATNQIPRGGNKKSVQQPSQTDLAEKPNGGKLAASPVVQRVNPEEEGKVVFPAILPTAGYMTRGFEPQRHFGLDIAGKTGTPVNSAAEGYVIFSGWTNEDGYVMIVSHAGGFLTYYKHNQSLLKSANSFVKRGEPIALMGNSGVTSSGPHLHFEIWKDGVPVDPVLFIINLNL